jgi:hypothetical protein
MTTTAPTLDWCHRCQDDTPTIYRAMRAGVGNLCAVCGSCRKGRPYVPKSFLTPPTPHTAVKSTYATASR